MPWQVIALIANACRLILVFGNYSEFRESSWIRIVLMPLSRGYATPIAGQE